MNRIEHLLACLGEECGEVQQVVGKSLRFGIYDCNPDFKLPNFELIQAEITDLIAVYELLCWEIGDDPILLDLGVAKKQQKVQKYMQYAIKAGVLDE